MKFTYPLVLSLLSLRLHALQQSDNSKLPACEKIEKPTASFQGVTPLTPPAPANGTYPPIPQDGISLTGWFAVDQAHVPHQPRSEADTALISHPPAASPPGPPGFTTNATELSMYATVKAIQLNSFDWKTARYGTLGGDAGVPIASSLKVVCKTTDPKASTATKDGFTFDDIRDATNVAPAHAKFGEDFRSVKECSFSFVATGNPSTKILMLLDNLAYDVWVLPRGASDCVVPS